MRSLKARASILIASASLSCCSAPQDVTVENVTGFAVTLRVLASNGERAYGPLASGSAHQIRIAEYYNDITGILYSYAGHNCSMSRETFEQTVFRNDRGRLVVKLPSC